MAFKIKVEDFSFYYGKKKALENINFNIEERKITALIGPSGCGKSTFLRSLNRMNDFIDNVKYEGKIIINDSDILNENISTIELRKSVGMVFQKPNVFPKSIYENVIYGPKRYGIKDKSKLDEIVEDSLKKAALWKEVKDVLNKSAFELSGGQQQRLCIARALASKPDIILMDEPTSALDPISTLKIEELMEELRENYTVVVVTHNMEQAARTSDYTGFFLNGKLIEIDSTNNVFSNPKNKKTEDYISGRFG
ncbi:MAG: phosphate ABC transporter ATP-binding protein [Clostridium argentinense]|uniref:phosphate ABC transporter ATP-binding protein PstB n=1 Tax=Clostridium butanoliproducens TaxID=2991837 RepID=UPI001D99E5C5|nr:phosphate ABC transporter ATP-binding protein PstB [Clostridium butanoliproducens]MBS5823639.1 phosphate ABC transporter ATP-binding protein [Clostridium argentinense]MDU1347718.1 phosphate ABC transporter ATP-binding protein PstB [Clostridium argentinense]